MRILFVDDHPHFAPIVIEQFLSGHEVVVAPSLAAAREALAGGEFQAVLTDYDLPDGKGDALVRWLKERRFPGAVVGISAREAGNAALEAAGADAVCPKTRFHSIGQVLPQGPPPARDPALALLDEALAVEDVSTGALLLNRAVDALLEVPFRAAGRPVPEPRDLLSRLEPEEAALAAAFLRAGSLEDRRRAARALARKMLGPSSA